MYALILAGGKGERLRPLTDKLPKVMVPVVTKPIIWHQLSWLEHHGVTNVMILGGNKSDIIRNYLSQCSDWSMDIEFSIERMPLGRGGAIKKGISILPKDADQFIVLNGDEISAVNLNDVVNLHRAKNAIATIVLVKPRSPFGVVDVDDDRIVSFNEKPQLPFWVSSGIYVMERSIEHLLPNVGDHEDTTFPLLASRHRLAAYKSFDLWHTINTLKELNESEAVISANASNMPWLNSLKL